MSGIRSFQGTTAEYRIVSEAPLSLVVQYDSSFLESERFVEHCEMMQDFLDSEDLAGIADLEDINIEEGTIRYQLNASHSLYEIVEFAHRPLGHKAAIEILMSCTDILLLAYYAAQIIGIESHGNLAPEKIWLNPKGELQLIHYGLTQFDVLHNDRAMNDVDRQTFKMTAVLEHFPMRPTPYTK